MKLYFESLPGPFNYIKNEITGIIYKLNCNFINPQNNAMYFLVRIDGGNTNIEFPCYDKPFARIIEYLKLKDDDVVTIKYSISNHYQELGNEMLSGHIQLYMHKLKKMYAS